MRFDNGVKISGPSFSHLLGDFITRFRNAKGDYMTRVNAIADGLDVDRLAGDLALALQQHANPKLREIGVRALEELAAAGHNRARFNLATLQLKGEVNSDRVPAELLAQVAQTECAEHDLKGRALAQLGGCYRHGRGVVCDLEKAVQMLEEAASLGVAEAAFQAGLAHDAKEIGGWGTLDYSKAAKFYADGAKLGHSECMTHLAVLYLALRVTPPSPHTGMDLLAKAAELGNRAARSMKAMFMDTGSTEAEAEVAGRAPLH
jgi:TPR repeat protein